MNSQKYIGLDVHQATISAAVMDPTGKLVMESPLFTRRPNSNNPHISTQRPRAPRARQNNDADPDANELSCDELS